jgi:psp operon transcriptional activator
MTVAALAFSPMPLAAALEANRFNQRRTANHLGLSYHQLRNALRKHGLLGQSGSPG